MGGEQASIEGFFEREVGEFGRGEWKQVVADGSAAEEVTAAAKQFPRARAGEDEPQPAPAHERVDLVEEGRQFLDLIDDHRLPLVGQSRTLLGEDAGIG